MPAIPSFESLIAEANEAGWYINNLFQRYDGVWQCNLRSETLVAGYGTGYDAALALCAALDNTSTAQPIKPAAAPTIILSDSDGVDLRALLAKLTPPSAPLTRRLGK